MREAPLIIGAGGGGGKGGGSSSGATEDPDTAASRAYAQIIDLISEGEIEGLVGGMQGVLLNGTPLQNPDGSFNFSGVSFAFQPGTQGQNYIAGFSDVENERSVGLVVMQQTPLIRTITDANIDAVRVTVNVPRLTTQDTKTGDIHGASVDVAIDVQTAGGGYVQRIYDTISAKVTSNYERSYRVDLWGAGPWDIRVRRVTADSTTSNVTDAITWFSYTEIIDAKLTYPNSAIAALRIDAAQFQAIPSRAYHVKLLRVQVPSNYDPIGRTYAGAWDGTFKIAWTNNPAWCFWDLLTNSRYGLGSYVSPSQVDKWSLYTIGQYCDQMVPDGFGSWEPRFSLNCYIQSYADAYKVVQDIASAFRGMVYWAGGTVSAVQDAPSDPVALFTPANVIDGQFTYAGASLKARHTVALVSWTNLQDMGKTYVEYVDDPDGIARYGVLTTQVTAFGCTSRGQAHRVGKWILYSERMESETCSFKIGLDGAGVRPGDVIKVADTQRAGARMGGRVSATDSAGAIVVDSDLVDVNGNPINVIGAALSIVAMDGTVRTGTIVAQSGRSLGAQSNQGYPSMMAGIQTQCIWVIEQPSLQAQLFRVVQIVETDAHQFEVTALAHNPSKYAAIEYGLALEHRDITDLSANPLAPSALTVSESLYMYQANVFSLVTISWPSVKAAVAYKIGYSKDGANWVFATTPSNDFEIRAAASGVYDVRVWTIGASEAQSANYVEAVQTIYGKLLPPADVAGLTFGIDQTAGAKLSWAPNTDVDLYAYEVRKGTAWNTATLLGQIKGTIFTIGVANCSGTYLVKAIDTSGNYSVNPASIVVTVPQAPAPVVTGVFSGPNYNLSWVSTPGYLATDHYEIRTDPNFGQPGAITTQKGTSYSAKVNWAGTTIFYVAAVDIGGNYSAAGQATLVVKIPILPVITQQVIDNNVLLRWTPADATLPLDHYIVARGATFATATVLGTLSGTFDVIFETTPGTFTYWIAGVDSAGNQGPAASISAFVNQPPDYVLRYNYDANFDGLIDDFRTGVIPTDFTASNATISAQKGAGLTLTGTGNGPLLTKSYQFIEVNPNGCEYPRVRITGQRIAGSGWAGKLFWSTASHGIDGTVAYQTTPAPNPAIGTKFVIEWDMRAPALGGADWMNNAIHGIALSLGTTAADVFLIEEFELVPFAATNIVEDVDGALVMPVNTTETYQQHFDSHSWTAPNDQVTKGGFPLYIEPGLTTATYLEYIDYGAILPASRVSVTPTYDIVDGAPSLAVKIEVSTDNTNWTAYNNTTAVYVSNFRYARYTVTVTGTTGRDILRLKGINYRYDVKLKNDAGNIQAISTDTNGTPVKFNVGFIDVTSLTVTANTTSPVFAVYNFVDVPNPTGFTVLLFDKNGNRIAGNVSWSAKGY